MVLHVKIKQVYGKDAIYPACATSVEFLKFLGLKTFTKDAINAAKVLGATFEQLTDVKEL